MVLDILLYVIIAMISTLMVILSIGLVLGIYFYIATYYLYNKTGKRNKQ